MRTDQILCTINCDPVKKKSVLGVYARDQIPQTINQRPVGFIFNTDRSDESGKHWLAVYLESYDKGEFFDSYGHPPQYFSLDFNLSYNERRLQSVTSNVCGQYCLYHLLHRCRNVSMNNIINTFSNDYKTNDDYVANYIETAFPYCLQNKDGLGVSQTCCSEIL